MVLSKQRKQEHKRFLVEGNKKYPDSFKDYSKIPDKTKEVPKEQKRLI